MGFELTRGDQDLSRNPTIEIDFAGTEAIGGSHGTKLKFQFPPIIKSDSKDNRWTQEMNSYLWEPQYHFKGGNARKISLLITYIVGGPTINGTEATTRNVSTEVKKIKSYFFIGGPGSSGKLPVFQVDKLYDHIYGSGKCAFRGHGVSVSFSDALIKDDEGIYPIKTEVTLSLEMVTQITPKDGKAKARHQNIPKRPQNTWY